MKAKDKLEIDFNAEINSEEVIYGFIATIVISLIIGAALGHSTTPNDKIEDGVTEVCYKFGAEEAVSVSYNGTEYKGELTINCMFSDNSIKTFTINIPVEQKSTRITGDIN